MGHRLASRVVLGLAVVMAWGHAQGKAKPPDVLITLERTACFGTCPSYTVTIDGSGNVVYQGRDFVRVKGRQTARIDPEEVARLVREFERMGFFSLKDEYTELVTDLPTQYIGIRIGDRSKRIRDYYNAPKELRALEDRVDEVAGTKRWVSREPGPRDL